jgi:deoxycytidylate deaminase
MDSDVLLVDTKNWWVDRMYLQDAMSAARHSTDPNTQVGAVLVLPAGGVVLSAWNGVPDALIGVGYPKTADTKNYCTEHAERTLLPIGGLTMYCTWAACAECSRCIIRFGIKRVVTLRKLVEATSPKWEASIQSGLHMMRDSGIQVVGWSGELGPKYSIRFSGRVVGNEDLL